MMKATRQTLRMMMVTGAMLLAIVSCKPKRPSGILSPTQMEELLVDYHLAQGMAEAYSGTQSMEEMRYIYIRAALKKHNIEEAVFDSSMIYYSANSEQFAVICAHVCDKVEALGGNAGTGNGGHDAMGKYARLTTQGDTANVWTGMRHTVLMPDILHNLLVLNWEADTATHAGDSFTWYCNSQKIAQGNLPDVCVQLILHYENDTVVSVTSHMLGNRETEISYSPTPPLDSIKPTSVTAMVFMPTHEQTAGDGQGKNMAEALLLQDISLVRMHRKPAADSEVKSPGETSADSAKSREGDSTAGAAIPASPQRVPLKQRPEPLQLHEARPHATTGQMRKENEMPPASPRSGMVPRRKARH
ncbi:MAG TPA: hypothetical protein DC006_05235 [Prevotellaceae bacterium]|nr:hypothetical protein [Prevotellaceae bacterium]HBE55445.1 hypothetical protein [Prevotellaceae bacterium]